MRSTHPRQLSWFAVFGVLALAAPLAHAQSITRTFQIVQAQSFSLVRFQLAEFSGETSFLPSQAGQFVATFNTTMGSFAVSSVQTSPIAGLCVIPVFPAGEVFGNFASLALQQVGPSAPGSLTPLVPNATWTLVHPPIPGGLLGNASYISEGSTCGRLGDAPCLWNAPLPPNTTRTIQVSLASLERTSDQWILRARIVAESPISAVSPWWGNVRLTATIVATAPADQAPTCRPDLDNSGSLTIDDIFIFLNAWFRNEPVADFDLSGAVGIDDIFIYLNAWFAGC